MPAAENSMLPPDRATLLIFIFSVWQKITAAPGAAFARRT
jgi:hypothetical protein